MVQFAFEMIKKLDQINKHSFNNFQLRIGEQPVQRVVCLLKLLYILNVSYS